MNRPIRSTVVYALVSGFLVIPLALLLSTYLYWPTALKLVLWADIAVYGVLMARWSGTRLLSVVFPLSILLGTALWPRTYSGFFILALGIFAWMRSGVCFHGAPMRALMAEVITVVGAAAMLMLIGSQSYAAWALNICLFFLVQSLYFFIVPTHRRSFKTGTPVDPFEQAVAEAKKVLEGF
ncbi:MAG: hypothetical protein PVH87_07810 [Desulfobacteraceae bacterium]|jgi:hypothetical protein